MALFSKRPRIEVCELCGKADLEGCGHLSKHVVEIRRDEPDWLPGDWRVQAQGEFTFLCTKCNSFPALKWPRAGAATSALQIHLGAVHHLGTFAMSGSRMNPPPMRTVSSKEPGERSQPPDSSNPPEISSERLAEANEFMEEWTRIVGQASDPVFYGALKRFGRLGDAVQATNTASGNASIFDIAQKQFNNDFGAMFEKPWKTWTQISRKANGIGDYVLPARVFFFAWAIENQVTFDLDLTSECGFEKPKPETYQAIASEALAAANAAPLHFSVVERTTAAPVTRRTIQVGTCQILGIEPPPEDEAAHRPPEEPFNIL